MSTMEGNYYGIIRAIYFRFGKRPKGTHILLLLAGRKEAEIVQLTAERRHPDPGSSVINVLLVVGNGHEETFKRGLTY